MFYSHVRHLYKVDVYYLYEMTMFYLQVIRVAKYACHYGTLSIYGMILTITVYIVFLFIVLSSSLEFKLVCIISESHQC